MPYRRTKKNKRNNRRSKKRTGVFRPQSTLAVGFPKTTAVKLRYVESRTINGGVGSIGSINYRANSCFDPYQSGVGHQPSGFDQWSLFYNHYVVVGSKCKATFSLTGTTASGGISVCGVYLSDDATYSADVNTLMEQSHTKKAKSYYSVEAGKPVTVTKGFSTKKFFNVTNVTDNISRLGAYITANPTENAYFVVFNGNANGTIDPPDVTVLVEIEYIVIFSEPKELPQS